MIDSRFKTIGLYGIDGFYNYGCEAIVRGTVIVLRSILPECKITYYSRRADVDRNQIDDLNVHVKQISNNIKLVNRIVNKIMRIFSIKYQISSDDYKQICDESDIIISIGGDIYTIPEHIRKKNSYEYYNSIVQFGEYVKKRNKKFIIFGASIGPFGAYEKAKGYYFKHLKKVDLIACRESNTMEYLNVNGINANLFFYPDPAFFVKHELLDSGKEVGGYIGVNLSPLSLHEMYGDITITQKKKLAVLISRIVWSTNKKVLLIPHVISPINQMDNDLSFLSEIYDLIKHDMKEQVELIADPGSFMQIKQYLRRCDIVIAARMHCAINAICESIPSILLSYSEKSKGIAKFVYGNDNWILSLDKLETELLYKINQMLYQRQSIHIYLQKRIEEICSSEINKDIFSKLIK